MALADVLLRPAWKRSFRANRGTDYSAGIADKAAYYRATNKQRLVCALLYDVAVFTSLNAILSVPGIDLHSISPNHPEVIKTMREVIRHIQPAGRTLQLEVTHGAWVSNMLSMRGVAFFRYMGISAGLSI